MEALPAIVGFPTSTRFAWPLRPMSDICELRYGRALTLNDRRLGDIPVYGSNGQTGHHDSALGHGPTVILGRKGQGNLGVKWCDGAFWVIDTAYYTEFSSDISPKFFYYFVDFVGLNHLKDGTSNPSLSRNTFGHQPIPVPPLAVQSSICSLLSALDDKIELNRQMNETLEAIARAIFKDWFIDFGPTRAKREGRVPYLVPDVWALFPDMLDEGMPEGWSLSSVGNEFKLTMGQSPPGDTYNGDGDGLPFFQGRTDFGFRYPSNRKFCSSPTRLANAGDTLISVRAPVGDLNMARDRCCIGRGVSAARHRSNARGYTYYALQSIQPALEAFEHTGTVFGAINKAQFERLEIVAPAPHVVEAFEVAAKPLDDRIELNTEEAEILAATRDFLLPKLLSGEIRIREAEAMVAAAA